MELRTSHGGLATGDLMITPLVNESTLALAYLNFERDGSLEKIFHEKPAGLRWFLDSFSKDTIDVLACSKLDEGGTPRLCGLGWINRFDNLTTHLKVDVGHGFFREYQKHGWPQVWCQLCLEYVFSRLNADVAYGVTPEPNRAAVIFARRLGFEMHGPLPMFTSWEGRPCAAYVETMTKEQWQGRGVFALAKKEVEDREYVWT